MLEKTLESPLDCKEIQSVHSEGDQPWDFLGRNDAKAETPVLWPPHEKGWLIGKDSDAGRDWVQEEKGTTEDKMAGWHHWLDGCESEWTPEIGDGQEGLACCASWRRKESDTTDQLSWSQVKMIGEWWSFSEIRLQHFQVSCRCKRIKICCLLLFVSSFLTFFVGYLFSTTASSWEFLGGPFF